MIAGSACISDFSYLTAVYMFDKVIEQITLNSCSKSMHKKEFKIAAACLYLAAKCEDPKYPFY